MAMRGPHSINARLKIGEASRKSWQDPDYRRRVIEALKKVGADPEKQKRKGEGRRLAWAEWRAERGLPPKGEQQ